ncbi:bone morphogenetic protein 4 [Neodiprion lecontei]|uniref:Bone morphogenetic protein 4 n=1 Tax=Neodiprion lecontei TaxID=441921 RepID=A0A6J0BIC0_NEOLC|nr:bone morphogenetic protein 4 [Neodiprion lecontei]
MGKYLIISLEFKYNNRQGETSKLFIAKEDSISEDLIRNPRICSEGGRCMSNRQNNSKNRYTCANLSLNKNGSICKRLQIIAVAVFAMTLLSLTRPTVASPTPSLKNSGKKISSEDGLNGYYNEPTMLHYDQFDADEELFSSDYRKPLEEDDPTTRTTDPDPLDSRELDKIRKSIMEDLGLTRIPDPSKANVSQSEYENAHREYLSRVESSGSEDQRTRRRLHVFYPADHVFENGSRRSYDGLMNNIEGVNSIYFPVEIPVHKNHAVDHATLRILIGGSEDVEEEVEVSIYQTTRSSRKPIAVQKTRVGSSAPRWVDFDSTEAVVSWVHDGEENLGFEVEVRRRGSETYNWKSVAPAALNVFTMSDRSVASGSRFRRATPDQLMSLHRGRRTECKGQNKKCCRHEMIVTFKDIRGFEFIIQPKTFDAGYCKGRCPPRYNPAHHHALIQSLIWKEDRKKAPRPCCAPSKLTELEILYYNENDPTKLKITNWKNMKVLECACS